MLGLHLNNNLKKMQTTSCHSSIHFVLMFQLNLFHATPEHPREKRFLITGLAQSAIMPFCVDTNIEEAHSHAI